MRLLRALRWACELVQKLAMETLADWDVAYLVFFTVQKVETRWAVVLGGLRAAMQDMCEGQPSE
jgi:hypothetical protein